jgi:hypothetical protein
MGMMLGSLRLSCTLWLRHAEVVHDCSMENPQLDVENAGA